MKRQELQAEFDRISFQISYIRKNAGKDHDEIIALSSQLLCVAICGSLEQSLKKIFIEYAKRKSNKVIYRPIEKICESYQNPKSHRILELIGLFDADFEKQMRILWEQELEVERSHIDNMVDDRITIAHRKKVHINVSHTKLDDYFRAYKSTVLRIYEHFL